MRTGFLLFLFGAEGCRVLELWFKIKSKTLQSKPIHYTDYTLNP